ncbi:efflux transporter outer membrane subunit [Stutzerimonas stutzeri]|uniref:RND transporter n=1 Tax=Stutzerimonas stutzeri KOS6 TaxID=1218352 RepID=A0A061JLY5_STUST|nr:efflux transporter outer membrane subunit [Stutzerimonas stutzeri]EWC39330.1 RND transporter [Stutzerimonas stutzeri KOS6]
MNATHTHLARLLAVALSSGLLGACSVGPDYQRPELPVAAAFSERPAASAPQASGDAAFWRRFGDAQLDSLVDAALAHNQDLLIALANYQQANALLRGARYDQFPTLTADVQAGNRRSSADQLPGVASGDRDNDEFAANLGFSWELDLVGRVRRSVEAQRADTAASAQDLAALQVAVVGELARSYFQLRGWQRQLQIAQSNAGNQTRTLETLQQRHRLGLATPFDVDRARTQLETTRSRIPALEAQIAVAIHRVAVLSGRMPQALTAELAVPTALPPLAAQAVSTAPGELLRRRPDIAAAERRLAASTARVGVATADLFPRFTLGGLIGTQAFESANLFERDSETRLLILGVDGSFLNVGRVRARIAAADAAAAADLARYERTVLTAMEETENALVRLSRSQREQAHLQQAAAAGERAAQMARLRFEQGAIDVLELLDADDARLQAEDAYARSHTDSIVASVALYQALAGGWSEQLPESGLAGR